MQSKVPTQCGQDMVRCVTRVCPLSVVPCRQTLLPEICVAQKQWPLASLSCSLSLTLLCGTEGFAECLLGEFCPGHVLGVPILAVGAAVPFERLLDSFVLGICCVCVG